MATQLHNPLATMSIRGGSLSHMFGKGVRDNGKRDHQGWDLLADEGTPTFAVASGTLQETRQTGYGLSLILQFEVDGHTRWAFYAHLSGVVSGLQRASAGDVIGFTGRDGYQKHKSYPSHLHFEIRTTLNLPKGSGTSGRENPRIYFPAVPGPDL